MVGDWVRIYSRILWYNANTILVEYYLTDDSKTQLKTLLWSTMRYVTLEDGKSSDHAGAVVDFLEATSLHLDPSCLDIRERVKQLKRELEQGG
jgi:acyl-CoA thioester hydrolase